jgi:hypothetical protein
MTGAVPYGPAERSGHPDISLVVSGRTLTSPAGRSFEYAIFPHSFECLGKSFFRQEPLASNAHSACPTMLSSLFSQPSRRHHSLMFNLGYLHWACGLPPSNSRQHMRRAYPRLALGAPSCRAVMWCCTTTNPRRCG